MMEIHDAFYAQAPPFPRSLLRQYSLNIPRPGTDGLHEKVVSHVRERWDHYQTKWRLTDPATTTIYDAEVVEVVFGEGTLGLELSILESKDKVMVKTYIGGPSPITVVAGGDLRKGLVVDAIDGVDVDTLPAMEVLKRLQHAPRPTTVRFTTCETSTVVCRLCECLVDVNQLEEHTEFCVFSCKHEQQADALNARLRRVASCITSSMRTEAIRASFSETDTQYYKTMRSIALQAAMCDIASIESFDLCVQLLKALEVADPDTLSSSSVVERGLKFTSRIADLIHTKMSQMRSTQKLLLTRDASLLSSAPAPFYRTKSLENNAVETSVSFLPSHRSSRISISDFDIIKPVSKGAFGRVYLARKKTTGDPYAIKVLAKAHVLRKKQLSHIETERNVLANVESPFVVKLFWTFQSKHNLFLVMEYLPGGDFMSLLECIVRLEENVASIYIAEIALALNHLHSKGCVHRDLKPDNILIGVNGHIKLTDFGLSEEAVTWDEADDRDEALYDLNESFACALTTTKHSDDDGDDDDGLHDEFLQAFASSPPRAVATSHQSVHRCGTPDYLSPEIILGDRHGAPVDYWALGVIIYEMLVGFPPFNDDTVEAIFSNILAGRIVWPNQDQRLSASAEHLINRLLEMDPEKRMGWDELRAHPFFVEHDINWDTLLETSPPFVPTLDDPYDTSYFNNRDLTEDFVDDDDDSVMPSTTNAITIPESDASPHYGYGSPLLTPTTPEAFRSFSFTNMNALAAAGREEAHGKILDDHASTFNLWL
ncbi:AGC protein kinase [Saprolegnia diclina VS20]|uniref:non-specific serine/threonine protein kinase n=1 Tax=Saprolegnia diclina (strain VS20) TaxID=1156394 RepID=T0R3H1_SAPDV|nr:AGC protein kinase [Saprolegnia diclina VS20]EQC41486.1 AGC protein kinase [Saprolegnia diclina VS20]|eukprot:XP_008605200.1 AGC protein kinase [Saprolegnia diclina VS20]